VREDQSSSIKQEKSRSFITPEAPVPNIQSSEGSQNIAEASTLVSQAATTDTFAVNQEVSDSQTLLVSTPPGETKGLVTADLEIGSVSAASVQSVSKVSTPPTPRSPRFARAQLQDESLSSLSRETSTSVTDVKAPRRKLPAVTLSSSKAIKVDDLSLSNPNSPHPDDGKSTNAQWAAASPSKALMSQLSQMNEKIAKQQQDVDVLKQENSRLLDEVQVLRNERQAFQQERVCERYRLLNHRYYYYRSSIQFCPKNTNRSRLKCGSSLSFKTKLMSKR
jgi:hypothetical protein